MRYLALAEAQRLINASRPDFRALYKRRSRPAPDTGSDPPHGRPISAPTSGTIAIRKSKSGKSRHIVLTEDGVEFFRSISAGRGRNEFLFFKGRGAPQYGRIRAEPMQDAYERAKIIPPIGFHGLRHTWASHAVMNGVPLIVVGKNLGQTRHPDGGKTLRASGAELRRRSDQGGRAAVWRRRYQRRRARFDELS